LGDQLVEQVHGRIAVALQVFHRALTGLQGFDLTLQAGHVLDLDVELLNGIGQDSITGLLRADHLHLNAVPDDHQDQTGDAGGHQAGHEGLLAQSSFLFAVRQEVDEDHARNLRMARPQAVR